MGPAGLFVENVMLEHLKLLLRIVVKIDVKVKIIIVLSRAGFARWCRDSVAARGCFWPLGAISYKAAICEDDGLERA